MKLRWITLWLLLIVTVGAVYAQKVEVPHSIHFADMQLDLSPAARKKIQTDVDALLRSEKYFLLKLEKIDAYFPLIEQTLKEENVPEDIKYLVIQESALVGDAISTSNAIGYWQFKEPAAREVGLAINHAVDERMNIITATRGAARYFKSNNTYFDNWLYALMAYNTGPGGALKMANKSRYGVKHMRLEGDTHWYVLKFLAHKVAFENAVGKNPHPKVQLFAYSDGSGKTLHEIAEEFKLQEADLEPYNRWLRTKRVPDDKQYYVIVPNFDGKPQEEMLAQSIPAKPEKQKDKEELQASNHAELTPVPDTHRFPVIEAFKRKGAQVKINGIPGIIAQEGDNIRSISERTGVSTSRIVAYNDLTSKKSAVIPSKPYYIRHKRNRGAARYHVAQPDETLWSISQRFGIKLKKLIRNNRLKQEEELQPGRVLWLRYIRPPNFPVEYRDIDFSQQPLTADVGAYPETSATERIEPHATTEKIRQEKSVNPQSYESWESGGQSDEREETNDQRPDLTAEETATPSPTDAEEDVFEDAEVVFVETRQTETDPLPDYHIVKKGETFYSIARLYDLSIPQIREYNHLTYEETLKVGQKLYLKASEKPETSAAPQAEAITFQYHEVKPGETLYGVARSYGITIKDLMEWNDKDNFNVSVGERLKIAKSAQN